MIIFKIFKVFVNTCVGKECVVYEIKDLALLIRD